MKDRQVAPGWTATTQRADPVYVADKCPHGTDVAHSLPEAIACGLLQAVRAARSLSQSQAARAIGVSVKALQAWEQGWRRSPTGLYRKAVERWLLRKTAKPRNRKR